MADASALPTDDDQQPGLTSASLESPSAGSEPPGEPTIDRAAPAEAEVTEADSIEVTAIQGESIEADLIEGESIEGEPTQTVAQDPGAGDAPQTEQGPEAAVASAEPAVPTPSPAIPTPAPSFAVPIPSFSSPEPALSLGFESVAKPPEASPTPVPAPLEPTPMAPTPEPAEAAFGATMVNAPEPGPEPAPAPEPGATPVTPPPVPTVATTIDLPARWDSAAAGPTGEGGEWALLLSKLQAWLGSGQLQVQLQAARTPLTLLAGLIALVVVLEIYGALLGVIDRFPLAPGLLELVGLIAVIRFGLTKLVRSQERRALIEGLQLRWKAFRGKA